MIFRERIQALVAKQALEIHISTKGKMRLTRVATPSHLLKVVGSLTNKTYKMSPKGIEEALVDVTKYIADYDAEYAPQPTVRVREVPRSDGDVVRSQVLIYSNMSARDAIVNGLLLLTGRAGDLTNEKVRNELNELTYRKGSALFLKQRGVELFCVLHNVVAADREAEDAKCTDR